MPKYTSRDRVKSGVPLGGIGAGKLEIMPNGTINHLTFQNNWSDPLKYDSSGALGFHFGVYAESDGKKTARLLQTGRLNSFPCVERIEYKGSFPFAHLKYHDRRLPVRVELSAFSPLIPGNVKDSSLPGAFFVFRIKNPTKKTVPVSFLASGRNTVGNWSVGRFNAVSRDKDLARLTFRNSRKDAMQDDFSMGDMSISVARDSGEIMHMADWNLHGECFKLRPESVRLDAWDCFSKMGRLPNTGEEKPTEGESQELGGALCVKFELKPGQSREIPVIYSWFFPVHTVGHAYASSFKNSAEVSRYMFDNKKRLHGRTRSWHDRMLSSAAPPWLNDALVNNLYPLFSGTWYGRKKEFAFYEAPVICPLMGTLDVRFYGSIPLSFLFPELELTSMKQFAAAQRQDGYIPHDLGKKRLDLPSDGTTFYRWKDLCSKFVLLCYRDYLITKDKAFLRKVYPAVKKAMDWQFMQDKNKDFLPDDEGQDQTFDMWNFYGANSYTSSIFLASLLAARKIARAFDDTRQEELYADWFKKGRKSFEEKLWNHRYFVNYVSSDKGFESSCTIGQLNGQWYAHMLGLGYIADKKKVKRAVKTILELNGTKSRYGLVNAVHADGKINNVSFHAKNVFPGMSYAFASLCIFEGFEKEGLALAKRVWENFAYNIKAAWNQPDVVDRRTGAAKFGDYYMRNMNIWGVFLALAKKDPELKKTLKAITKPIQ